MASDSEGTVGSDQEGNCLRQVVSDSEVTLTVTMASDQEGNCLRNRWSVTLR